MSNNVAGQPEEILDEEQETFETVNASETAGTNGNSDAEEAFEEDIPLVYGNSNDFVRIAGCLCCLFYSEWKSYTIE